MIKIAFWRDFLGEHAPKPPKNLAPSALLPSLPPPVSSPWRRHWLSTPTKYLLSTEQVYIAYRYCVVIFLRLKYYFNRHYKIFHSRLLLCDFTNLHKYDFPLQKQTTLEIELIKIQHSIDI